MPAVHPTLRTGISEEGTPDEAAVPLDVVKPADDPAGIVYSELVATQRISVRLNVVIALP
jgi:hypothetical protein